MCVSDAIIVCGLFDGVSRRLQAAHPPLQWDIEGRSPGGGCSGPPRVVFLYPLPSTFHYIQSIVMTDRYPCRSFVSRAVSAHWCALPALPRAGVCSARAPRVPLNQGCGRATPLSSYGEARLSADKTTAEVEHMPRLSGHASITSALSLELVPGLSKHSIVPIHISIDNRRPPRLAPQFVPHS